MLNHWDNLDGSIERGYAGKSIFWNSKVKGEAWKARIRAYGRANLSVGINGCVLNNVNASPKVPTRAYIDTVRMIADILRPYYVKVYLSVNFGSPLALGATTTADPLNADVIGGGARRSKRSTGRCPTSAGSSSKPTRKDSRDRSTMAAPMPMVPTCWRMR